MSLNGSGVMIPDERHQSMRCLGQPQELVVDHGKRYCITLINANADSHVFHMHGHTFTTLETSTSPIRSTAGSVSEQMAAWRDSVLVPGGQCSRRTICFEADNAAGGVWPFHCHMAYHLASGMMLLIRYQEDGNRGGEVCQRLAAIEDQERRKVKQKMAEGVACVLAAIALGWMVVLGLRHRHKRDLYYTMPLPTVTQPYAV